MGRFFYYLAIVYFWQFFEDYRSSPEIATSFFLCENYELILKKMGCAHLGDFFSQTYLVTPVVRAG
jgi:hypothetical protein